MTCAHVFCQLLRQTVTANLYFQFLGCYHGSMMLLREGGISFFDSWNPCLLGHEQAIDTPWRRRKGWVIEGVLSTFDVTGIVQKMKISKEKAFRFLYLHSPKGPENLSWKHEGSTVTLENMVSAKISISVLPISLFSILIDSDSQFLRRFRFFN